MYTMVQGRAEYSITRIRIWTRVTLVKSTKLVDKELDSCMCVRMC